MAFFKIVATKEKRGVYFTAVPHQWEKNKTLFWPEHLTHSQRELLRQDSSSVPEEHWKKYNCILKCSNLHTFDDSLRIEKQLTECLDTDAEEELFATNYQKKSRTHRALQSCNSYVADRNGMFTEFEKNGNVQILSQNILNPASSEQQNFNDLLIQTTPAANEQYIVLNDGNLKTVDETDSQAEVITENNMSKDLAEIKQDIYDIKNEIKSIKTSMSDMFKEIKEQYIKINVNLDKIHDKFAEPIKTKEPNENDLEMENLLRNFKFPISECEDLLLMEEQIKINPEFKKQLVEFMIQIGGKSGEENGAKVAYKLADTIFSPHLLTHFSWTGVSRGKSSEKKPFQMFTNILEVFFTVLKKADNRFTIQKTANIFKDGLLKHAQKRSERKRRKVCDTDQKENEGKACDEEEEKENEVMEILPENIQEKETQNQDKNTPEEVM